MTGYNAVLARNTESAPQSVGAHSQTVAFSHYNHLSAQLPIDPKSGDMVAGGIKEQAGQCLENIKAILDSIGHVMEDVVRITIFTRSISDVAAIDAVFHEYFPGYVPARTTVAAAALPMDALVQIEALVSNGEGTIPGAPPACDLVKIARNTDKAPGSSYSTQTVAFSHYNNLSAQLPIDPRSGEIVAGDAKVQAEQCLKNVKAIVESIDHSMQDVVKVTIFLTDLSDLQAVSEAYTGFFPSAAASGVATYLPALTSVVVSALPMDALVQIEAVVSHGDGTPPQAVEDRHGLVIEANDTENAPRNSLSSQTVAFSHYNHLSGQLPIDPESGEVVAGGVREQAGRCLKNIKAIVESVGHVMDDVVKVNIFLRDIADGNAVDEVYARFFPAGVPARRTVGVSALPGDALVQIEVVVSNAEGTPPRA